MTPLGRSSAVTPVVLAVDIGTSGVRVVAFDAQYGVHGERNAPLAVTVGADGRAVQDWPEVLRGVCEGLAALAADPALEVLAVALSGTASSLAVYETRPSGELVVEELVLWSDTRARGSLPLVAEAAADAFERTLCPVHVSYWPAKLRRLTDASAEASSAGVVSGGASVAASGDEPANARAVGEASVASSPGPAARFADIKGLVFRHLTGRDWIDPMTAASTGVYDSAAGRWDAELLRVVGVDPSRLSEPRAATETAALTAAGADATGLAAGTPIVLGGMDGPLSQLGAAGFDTAAHSCTVGTSIAYRAGHRGRVVDPGRRVWCYPVVGDFWVAGGAGSNGGNVMAWLAGLLGLELGGLLDRALALDPDPGLTVLPYLNGERAPLWRDDLGAAVVGLGPHHGPAELARASLDAVGAVAIELAETVVGVAGAAREVRLTGGFLRSEGWSQLMTDALGIRTVEPEPAVSTALGAAMIGFLALGESPETLPPVAAGRVREPRAEVHETLRARSDELRRVRAALYPGSDAAARDEASAGATGTATERSAHAGPVDAGRTDAGSADAGSTATATATDRRRAAPADAGRAGAEPERPERGVAR